MVDTSTKHKLSIAEEVDEKAYRAQRGQWLRAAILGANDGLLSTTSLMLGMGAAREDRRSMILSGLAGAVAGACSMAVGEFVSVSTQRDIEEMGRSVRNSRNEHAKLEIKLNSCSPIPSSSPSTTIESGLSNGNCLPVSPTQSRGQDMTPNRRSQILSPIIRSPMMKVISEDADTKSMELKKEEAFEVEEALPNPIKAAVASASAFLCGSIVPLLSGMFFDDNKTRIIVIISVTTIALAVFGGVGAHLGGSRVRVSAARVLIGGWIAMAITYGLLKSFNKHPGGEDGD